MMPLQDTPPQGLDADHRANRLLAALEPEDFAGLEPHLESVELTRGQVLYDTGRGRLRMPTSRTTRWCRS